MGFGIISSSAAVSGNGGNGWSDCRLGMIKAGGNGGGNGNGAGAGITPAGGGNPGGNGNAGAASHGGH